MSLRSAETDGKLGNCSWLLLNPRHANRVLIFMGKPQWLDPVSVCECLALTASRSIVCCLITSADSTNRAFSSNLSVNSHPNTRTIRTLSLEYHITMIINTMIARRTESAGWRWCLWCWWDDQLLWFGCWCDMMSWSRSGSTLRIWRYINVEEELIFVIGFIASTVNRRSHIRIHENNHENT